MDFPEAYLLMILAGALVVAVLIVGMAGSVLRKSSGPYGWIFALTLVDASIWMRFGAYIGLAFAGLVIVVAAFAFCIQRLRNRR